MIGVGQRLSRSDRWSGQLHHTNLGLVKDSLDMTCVQPSVLMGLLLPLYVALVSYVLLTSMDREARSLSVRINCFWGGCELVCGTTIHATLVGRLDNAPTYA